MIYDGGKAVNGVGLFNEENAAKTGLILERGYELMGRLLQK